MYEQNRAEIKIRETINKRMSLDGASLYGFRIYSTVSSTMYLVTVLDGRLILYMYDTGVDQWFGYNFKDPLREHENIIRCSTSIRPDGDITWASHQTMSDIFYSGGYTKYVAETILRERGTPYG